MIDQLTAVHNQYRKLKQQAQDLDNQMIELKRLGMVNARIYWMRKDDPGGKPDQLELTHSTRSEYYQKHNTRREYVGVHPAKIQEALASIERYKQYKELRSELRKVTAKIEAIERQVKNLEHVTFSEQTGFWYS